MGLWHNPDATQTMNFTIAGNKYTVPPECVVNIPAHLEYVVKSSQLRLERGPGPKGKDAAVIAGELIRPVQNRAVTDANVGQRTPRLQAVPAADDIGEDEMEGLNADGTFANAAGDEPAGSDGDDTPSAGADAVDRAAAKLRGAGAKLPRAARSQ